MFWALCKLIKFGLGTPVRRLSLKRVRTTWHFGVSGEQNGKEPLAGVVTLEPEIECSWDSDAAGLIIGCLPEPEKIGEVEPEAEGVSEDGPASRLQL